MIVISQRILDKLIDKFIQAAEMGHGELNVKIDDQSVIFTVSEKEKDILD